MANRFQSYWQSAEKPLPRKLLAHSLEPQEVLFLALHAQDRFVNKITDGSQDDAWVNAIAAGFASLLQNCDIENHTRIYHGSSDWHTDVRPPSVIATQLLMFLGRLSVASPVIYELCLRRGSIQGFLRILEDLKYWIDTGAEEQLALM